MTDKAEEAFKWTVGVYLLRREDNSIYIFTCL